MIVTFISENNFLWNVDVFINFNQVQSYTFKIQAIKSMKNYDFLN